MGDQLINGIVTVATAIVGVAILAVLVSRNAQTPAVINAGGSAFANSLLAAEAPVTGSSPVSSGTFNFGGGAELPSVY
jgi:hypothetical protein